MSTDDWMCILLIICSVLLGAFCFNLLFFHISPAQSEPTSELIITTITVTDIAKVSLLPGQAMEYIDETGRGYYYVNWFDYPMVISGTYQIQYYCNKDGNRQIYSFTTIPPVTPPEPPAQPDPAKCIYINGDCQ